MGYDIFHDLRLDVERFSSFLLCIYHGVSFLLFLTRLIRMAYTIKVMLITDVSDMSRDSQRRNLCTIKENF